MSETREAYTTATQTDAIPGMAALLLSPQWRNLIKYLEHQRRVGARLAVIDLKTLQVGTVISLEDMRSS